MEYSLSMRNVVCFLVGCSVLIQSSCQSFSPIIIPRADFSKNPMCQRQSQAYLQAFRNFTLWAVQMHDASAELPNGILAANNYHLGNFDECLAISADLGPAKGGLVEGKYCLVKLQLGTEVPHSPPRDSIEFEPFANVWDKIRPSGELSIWRRDSGYWGICVPSACGARDIQRDVEEFLLHQSWFGQYVKATVDPTLCQTRESVRSAALSPLLDSFTKYLFIALFSLVIGSTMYEANAAHRNSSSQGLVRKLFVCFSLRKNLPNAFRVNPSPDNFDGMTGGRTILTFLVLYGHRWRMLIISPLVEATTFEQMARSFSFLTSCLCIINGFFGASGFLVGYYFYSELEKREKANKLNMKIIVGTFLNRVFRFLPMYAVAVLLNLTLVPKLGDGPMWPLTGLQDTEQCRQSWWTNLLFINNYVKPDQMCMYQTWYLSVDVQCLLLSLIVLYILKRNRLFGVIIFTALIVGSMLWHATQLYIRNDESFMFVDEQRLRKVPNEYYYITYYIATHFRLPAYMCSVLIGVYACERRDKPSILSRTQTYVYTGLLAAAIIILQASGHWFFDPAGIRNNMIAKITYGALHCPLWAVLFVSAFYLNAGKDDTWMHKVFTVSPLMILNKFSYGVFLLHSMIHSIEFGSIRTPRSPSRQAEYWLTVGDIFFVYLFSFVFYLLVETPFARMQKLLLFGDGKKEKTECNDAPKKIE